MSPMHYVYLAVLLMLPLVYVPFAFLGASALANPRFRMSAVMSGSRPRKAR